MSASSKKKLRKEAQAAMLTEKQKKEQAEAKKLKAITISFVAVMLAVVLTATGILSVRGINNSGIIDKNTIAAVIGQHELNSIEMNYYFVDHVRNMYHQWETDYGDSTSMYLSMMGLDLNKPLNEQKSTIDENQTWADFFLDGAMKKAKDDYAMYDKAMADPNFELPASDKAALETNEQMLDLYATYGGFKSANKYLQAIYGHGANVESYNKYSEVTAVASAYYNAYKESLTYNDAAIREHEKDKFDNYSSFSYAVYAVNVSDYLTGGTKNEDGNTTYTDAEKEAAQKKAEEIANQLQAAAGLDELDQAIAALEINKDKTVSSTKNDLIKYTELSASYKTWLADKEREAGDITVIPNESTTKDADGNETKTVNGYYVLAFRERNDNLRPLANVRHNLVKFEGGTTDASGNKTYSDTEKATAKAEAEKLLQAWKDGNATEETFIEMVKNNTDDTGSKETGGLFEDLHPDSPYVESFLAWSLDTARKTGDTGIIVSDYGYHIMYYVGDDTLTYRDYMISEDLRAADVEKWCNGIVEPVTITSGKTNRLNLDLIISSIV